MFFDKKIGLFEESLHENISLVSDNNFHYLIPIFCVFSEKHKKSKQEAATFLKTILEKLSFNDVIKVDAQMRQATSTEWFIDWAKLDEKDLLLSTMTKEEKQAVLVFASFNPNGFLREKAVRLLAHYDKSLPYILLRKNDWVGQVREAANESFLYRMNNLSDGELLASLPFAEKLNRSVRTTHSNDTRKIYNSLLEPANKKDLELGLASKNMYTRRLCVDALITIDTPDVKRILAHLRNETVPHIKMTMYKKLLTLDNCPVDSVLEQMLANKYPKIRSYSLLYIFERDKSKASDIAIAYLVDKNSAVRSTARWMLSTCNETFDFRRFYSEKLASNTYAAICGLGETGIKEDTIQIQQFLSNETVSIVRATMRALMFLDSNTYGISIVKMMVDSPIGIIKESFQLLMNYGVNPYAKEIYSIFENTQSTYTRYKCAVLLFRSAKWEAIICILEALSNQDESVSELAQRALTKWIVGFNNSFATPNSTQKEKILQLFSQQSSFINKKDSRSLSFLIK